jgi:hypothetical protein
MKTTLATILAGIALAVPATASAHPTFCGRTSAEISVDALGVSCATGWQIERYWFARQYRTSYRVRIAGRTWTGGRDSFNPYVVNFESGWRVVEIDLP